MGFFRCICFGGNGLVHESLKPKAAVRDALRNATPDRLKWKHQGYSASTSGKMTETLLREVEKP